MGDVAPLDLAAFADERRNAPPRLPRRLVLREVHPGALDDAADAKRPN
jgi:hypothetical protein